MFSTENLDFVELPTKTGLIVPSAVSYYTAMVLDKIKDEVEKLSPEERKELSLFLNKIHLQSDVEFWERIRGRIEDPDPERWISIDDID